MWSVPSLSPDLNVLSGQATFTPGVCSAHLVPPAPRLYNSGHTLVAKTSSEVAKWPNAQGHKP